MREVNPKETTRAYAFEMWINAPMPIVQEEIDHLNSKL